MTTSLTWKGRVMQAEPIADGASFYLPNFAEEAGIDTNDLMEDLFEREYNPRDAAYMKYRGNNLARSKIFINLDEDADKVYK